MRMVRRRVREGALMDESRRDLIKKAVLGGGLVWAMPVIQSVTSPAFAGSVPRTNGIHTASLDGPVGSPLHGSTRAKLSAVPPTNAIALNHAVSGRCESWKMVPVLIVNCARQARH